jgi:DNA-binding MarR family transcriptional regulator
MKSYDDCIIFLLAKAYQKAHGKIKRRLVLDGATLSGVLDRLTSGGWIIKESDADDKRVLRNYLTSKSKDLKPKLSETRNQTNEELLRAFTIEEKVLLKRFLRDMQ